MCIPWCRNRKPSPTYYRLGSIDSFEPRFDIDRSKFRIMGQPPSQPSAGSNFPPRSHPAVVPTPASAPLYNRQLSIQHERLILELLPFKDPNAFQDWLQSVFIRGSWLEFCRDFLSKQPMALEPDKETTAKAARDAISHRSQKYLVYHPDKTGWTVEDHHVRFIVTVIQDNLLRGMWDGVKWSDPDFKRRAADIPNAVFEVLAYLRASFAVADLSPPVYSQ